VPRVGKRSGTVGAGVANGEGTRTGTRYTKREMMVEGERKASGCHRGDFWVCN